MKREPRTKEQDFDELLARADRGETSQLHPITSQLAPLQKRVVLGRLNREEVLLLRDLVRTMDHLYEESEGDGRGYEKLSMCVFVDAITQVVVEAGRRSSVDTSAISQLIIEWWNERLGEAVGEVPTKTRVEIAFRELLAAADGGSRSGQADTQPDKLKKNYAIKHLPEDVKSAGKYLKKALVEIGQGLRKTMPRVAILAEYYNTDEDDRRVTAMAKSLQPCRYGPFFDFPKDVKKRTRKRTRRGIV